MKDNQTVTFTKGPWKSHGADVYPSICFCMTADKPKEEAEANAALISKAPALYDALKESLTWLNELQQWYLRESESFEGDEMRMYLDHSASVAKVMRSANEALNL
jgi:hypothetical protein